MIAIPAWCDAREVLVQDRETVEVTPTGERVYRQHLVRVTATPHPTFEIIEGLKSHQERAA